MKLKFKSLLETLLFLSIMAINTFSYAQITSIEKKDSTDLPGWYAFGGIGPAIPLGKFGDERTSGFDLNTAVEYRYKSGFLVRGMFDFSSFQFARGTISQISNGTTYKVGGANNLVSLLVSGGYYLKMGRFAPYAFAGLGASFVSIPTIDIDKVNNFIDTDLSVKGYFSTISGAGVDFIVRQAKVISGTKKRSAITLYLETFYTYIPSTTETSVHKFNLLSVNVGLKSKL